MSDKHTPTIPQEMPKFVARSGEARMCWAEFVVPMREQLESAQREIERLKEVRDKLADALEMSGGFDVGFEYGADASGLKEVTAERDRLSAINKEMREAAQAYRDFVHTHGEMRPMFGMEYFDKLKELDALLSRSEQAPTTEQKLGAGQQFSKPYQL